MALLTPYRDAVNQPIADFIEGSYVLEVSSPGFDRPVRKPEDFGRFVGERIVVKVGTLQEDVFPEARYSSLIDKTSYGF